MSVRDENFRCFVCNTGGDVFALYMRLEGVDFPRALQNLAAHYGVAGVREELATKRRRQRELKKKLKAQRLERYDRKLRERIAVARYARRLWKITGVDWIYAFMARADCLMEMASANRDAAAASEKAPFGEALRMSLPRSGGSDLCEDLAGGPLDVDSGVPYLQSEVFVPWRGRDLRAEAQAACAGGGPGAGERGARDVPGLEGDLL